MKGRFVASTSQIKASSSHRRRRAARGLVRVEVQAARSDAGLIRALARTLRGEPASANAVRAVLEAALAEPGAKTAFDVFGTDLPDETFEGVFDQPRRMSWREVDL